MALTEAQEKALAHFRAAYVGPEQGDEEVLIENRPSLQYVVGMLFPLDAEADRSPSPAGANGSLEYVEADVDEGDVEESDGSGTLAEDWRPSSAAISFVTNVDSVLCDFACGTYALVEDDGPQRWQRSAHAFADLELSRTGPQIRQLFAGAVPLEIGTRWRPYGASKWLVTLHVRIRAQATGDDRADIPQMLFQVDLSARAGEGGQILEYDVSRALDVDAEAAELRLRYRERKVFAVGHGMAATWETDESGNCLRVQLDPVPHFVVPAIEQAGASTLHERARPALDLDFLARLDTDPKAVTEALYHFVDAFSTWVAGQQAKARDLGPTAMSVVDRSTNAERRMRAGVDLLADPESRDVRLSFALAMSAMRLQMHQAALARGEKDPHPAWRPFQLGFLLVSLASTVDEHHSDRSLVDLIWFPTGGGKTEAYLALAAIEIFLRRIKYGQEGGGTAVITRYTLRLLTSQQFQRAASLICAMELLRQRDNRAKGMARFSIGLWVGNEATPGTRDQARYALERLYKAQHPQEANEFQITECPWCLAELVPERKDDSRQTYGARMVGRDVAFRCVDVTCEFSSRDLPMNVVDELLYEEPPTFLLATVDKFARLQFKQAAGRLLGIGTPYRSPSLIIQDELHLLSGPLGTTVAVFDAVLQALLGASGSVPKIVASTATIRASESQVRGLYGRSVSLYPPAGLDGDSTFFSRPVASGEGRLYLGLMPQSVSQATALVAAASPMLELPGVLVDDASRVGGLDPYWTLVMYHNSLRELGRSSALLLDDVNGRLATRADRLNLERRTVRADRVLELTSRRGPEELPKDLRRLRTSADLSDDAVDAVLSSNMLSVGIDVQRLALLLMVGQPKTTAEYIQATSRVGRGSTNGIVVTLFRPNRARDRSHFETFRGFHDALYRSVEPTSVTPWSLSSRDRSLSGALVALMRHSVTVISADDGAGSLDLSNPRLKAASDKLADEFLAFVAAADESEEEAARVQVGLLLREWDRKAKSARDSGNKLYYERHPSRDAALVKRFGQTGDEWLVADSMRSVEPNVAVEVQEPEREVQRAEDSA
ncbi:helicase-like protein [Microcella putealis]|uniref:Helicase-like protein n=1 Tax=Microcella putealis TaxID=337005 RepID=A0A4Q7LM28_9MICO|nr:helicase-related protein [Microcella putealis]RZS55231.1 helicase-like protein [Microcella putealis]TQM23507.1 helicase-like protein [Microcella putealis]